MRYRVLLKRMMYGSVEIEAASADAAQERYESGDFEEIEWDEDIQEWEVDGIEEVK